MLLVVVVHAANLHDRDGAKLVFKKARNWFKRLRLIWADQGYAGKLIGYVKRYCKPWTLEVVKRLTGVKGFHVLPQRWIVERTFAWLGKYRRLSKDYEYKIETSETMIRLAMIHVMIRRLAPP